MGSETVLAIKVGDGDPVTHPVLTAIVDQLLRDGFIVGQLATRSISVYLPVSSNGKMTCDVLCRIAHYLTSVLFDDDCLIVGQIANDERPIKISLADPDWLIHLNGALITAVRQFDSGQPLDRSRYQHQSIPPEGEERESRIDFCKGLISRA